VHFMRHTISIWKYMHSPEAEKNSQGDGSWAELHDKVCELCNLTSLEKTILGRLFKALAILFISDALHFFLVIMPFLA
jgi:hypothetical protein